MKLNAERVKEALIANGMTPASLADKIGVARSTVHRWLQGTQDMRSDKVALVAEGLNMALNDVVAGEEFDFENLRPTTEKLVSIEEMKLSENDTWERVPGGMVLRYSQSVLGRYSTTEERLMLTKIDGDGMAPTIPSNAMVLWIRNEITDPAKAEIRDGSIYVLSVAGRYRVRRLRAVRNGVVVYGDSDEIQAETFSASDFEELKIHGRVVEATQYFD